jgi:hypothetical protein
MRTCGRVPSRSPARVPVRVREQIPAHGPQVKPICIVFHDELYLVTDGPALRIVIDQNSNDKIDDPDMQMGGIVRLYSDGAPLYGNDSVTLLVEWISTPEFGPVKKIDLYVGTRTSQKIVDPDETDHGRTYAPEWHGTRDTTADPPSVSSGGYPSANGRFYTKMGDGYWLDPTGNLRVALSPGDPEAYAGTRAIALDLEVFEAMRDVPGDRFFFRAFAETQAASSAPRYVFTNPLWVIRQTRFEPVDTIDPHIPQTGSMGAKRSPKPLTGGR